MVGLKKSSLYSLVIYLYFYASLFILPIQVLVWMHSCEIGKSIKEFIDQYLIVLLAPLSINYCERSQIDIPRIVDIAFFILLVVALPDPYFNFYGLRWQYTSIILYTWMALHIYVKNPCINNLPLTLSCINIASIIYETPWIITNGDILIYLKPKFSLSLMILAYSKMKQTKTTYLTIPALIFTWIFFNQISCIPYIGRILVRMPAVAVFLSMYLHR